MPRLAITLGDVRGIGPEIVLKAAASREVRDAAALVFVGPSGAGVDVDEQTGEWLATDPVASAGRFAGRAIERAVALAAEGAVDGIVTAPLDKAALLAGGYSYPGHTEMLATLTGRRVAMMLAATKPAAGAANPLRVVLATTHIPLRDVVSAVTRNAILDAARITRSGLRDWFGISEPRIGCGSILLGSVVEEVRVHAAGRQQRDAHATAQLGRECARESDHAELARTIRGPIRHGPMAERRCHRDDRGRRW